MRIFFSTVMKMWIGPGKFWIDRLEKTVWGGSGIIDDRRVFGLTVQAGGKVMPIIGVRTRIGFGGGSFAGFPMRCRRYKGLKMEEPPFPLVVDPQ